MDTYENWFLVISVSICICQHAELGVKELILDKMRKHFSQKITNDYANKLKK
jgi:hypothetical protein